MTTLFQKLQLKPGQQMVMLNAPQGSLDRLSPELQGITLTDGASGEPDALLLFVNSLAETERLAPEAIRAVKADGLLWIAYPKGASKVKTDVNRGRLWEAMQPTGWRPVRQIALDEVWSALRFRPADKVGT
jgi:hypothetical protein